MTGLAGIAFALAALALRAAPPELPSTQGATAFDVDRALDSVVLLVSQADDSGTASFGSGVVVDAQGNIVTNLHVVAGARHIRALAYDRTRPTFAAMDGGLGRLVFERERELVAVQLVRGDPTLDLAVLRPSRPLPARPMAIATRAPRVGDIVTALGHPEQNFWSLTRGQVSAVREGLIQHDAAVNRGNSGGPLVDAKGELVGINTMFLKGAQGISYARPITLLQNVLADVVAPVRLDLSTPEKAFLSCHHARELADPAYEQCVDWDSAYAAFEGLTRKLMTGELDGPLTRRPDDPPRPLVGKPRAVATLDAWLRSGDGRREVWAKRYRDVLLTFTLGADLATVGRAMDSYFAYLEDGTRGGRPPRRPPEPSELRAASSVNIEWVEPASGDAALSQPPQDSGLKVPLSDIQGIRQTLKMGLRVERVMVDAHGAWVAVAGRNLDGSHYRFSSRFRRDGDVWREVHVLRPQDAPPRGFPPFLQFAHVPVESALVLGTSIVARFLASDAPDGISTDWAMELYLPPYVEAMRRVIQSGSAASSAQDAAKR